MHTVTVLASALFGFRFLGESQVVVRRLLQRTILK